MIGFWHCKGQNLNVQLYIYSFILFKLSDSLQSGLNISYRIKNLRVTQISQRGLNERRLLNVIVTEIREQLNDLIKI